MSNKKYDNIIVGIYITIMILIMTVVSDHINIIRRQWVSSVEGGQAESLFWVVTLHDYFFGP